MPTPEDCDRLLDELAARAQIHDCLMRYCRGLDRLDAALVASAFHADAVDHHSFATLNGAAAIGVALVDRQRTRFRQTMHGILNEHVEIAGDVAHGESYFRASMVAERDGREVLIEGAGRYVDRFERRMGAWRIAERVLVNEWSNWVPFNPPAKSDDFVGTPGEPRAATSTGASPLLSRDDVSYRR